MKKILFVIPSFGIGGTSVSTKNLISLLPHEQFDCYVLPLLDKGEMKAQYASFQVLTPSFLLETLFANSWKDNKGLINRIIAVFVRFFKNHIGFIRQLLYQKAFSESISNISFDTIIACQESSPTLFLSAIKHPNKIAWVRCDYKRWCSDNKRDEYDIYKGYNAIVCVSEQTSQSFREVYPVFSDKVYAINNPQNAQNIIEQSLEPIENTDFIKNGFTIVSIGRINPIKRFSTIPTVACELKQAGLSFKWFIIGDGDAQEKKCIQKEILELKVEDVVVMLGMQTNPYNYISQSNILVCLSRSEACPRVINEAKILKVPTITTDYPSAKEYITSGYDGIITSINEMASVIKNTISNTELYEKLKHNVSLFSFDNSTVLKNIIDLL